jgi:two-component system chemotaxis sensor kinase CheA
MAKEEEFLKSLLAIFRTEAEEHISSITSGLIELEKQPPPERQKEIIEVVFREAHSLKGAARSVNLSNIEMLCQAMESLFAAAKRGEVSLTTPHFDLLNDAADIVSKLLSISDTALTPENRSSIQAIQQGLTDAAKGATLPARPTPHPADLPQGEGEPEVSPHLLQGEKELRNTPPLTGGDEGEGDRFIGTSHNASEQKQPEPQQAPSAEKAYASSESIRIPAAKLDSLLLKAEEMISVKLAARQHASSARELKTMLEQWQEQWARVSSGSHKIGQLIETEKAVAVDERAGGSFTRIKEFLDWNYGFNRSLENKILGLRKSSDEDFRAIGSMVDDLLNDMKNVMMFPFSSVLATFPKLVRDISREQGKELELTMQGGDIEIDRRILQEIKDPLIHLVRNSIDHGIENKETRRMKKKPEKGRLRIAVSQKDSSKVEIIIADDGAGLDLEKLKASAIRQGIITKEQAEALNREEAINLMFESGLSTSHIITTVSGRGLGLPIVREKVERLGGTISIDTRPDRGTTFRLMLPLTVATFRGILIQTGGQVFVVPTMNVERIERVPKDDVKTVENRETIQFNGMAVSLISLDEILEFPLKAADEDARFITVMVLSAGDKYIAFRINEILNEEEILFKNLGKQLARVRNIAGATVLGTGEIVPILNVTDMLKSALRIAAGPVRTVAAEKGKKEAKKQSIVVVGDSITARTLLVNILESSGYIVTSAVDGVDGFTKLIAGDFDLVVSDLSMPKMDGFELVKKIRADKKYGEIPIVLVTDIESPEDKKRGIDVGANAYIVKSSFDQSNLLDVIKRLI